MAEGAGFTTMAAAAAEGEAPKVGVGMLGYAFMGKAHSNAFKKLPYMIYPPPAVPEMVAICGRNEEATRAAAVRFGYETYYTDWRKMIADDRVQLFDNGGPNDAHAEPCIAAAQAGKHILCEKPLARTAEEAKGMLDAVQKAGVKHMVAFNYRFVPAIRQIRKLIESGALGRIYHFRAVYLQEWIMPHYNMPMIWRLDKKVAGSGALGDLGAHIIDLVVWMAGPIVEVMAESRIVIPRRPLTAGGSALGPVDTDDETRALIRLGSGATGTLETSRVTIGAANDLVFEIQGDRGALRYSLDDPNGLWAYDGTVSEPRRGWTRIETIQRYAGAAHPDWAAAIGVARGHAESQYQFARAVWDRTAGDPGVDAGIAAQAVIEAAYRSASARAWAAVDMEPQE
jgi:predicted dehydrogenase